VLFIGNGAYDLPLAPAVARKWDLVAERLEIRVIGRAGTVEADDPRFRLAGGRARWAGSFHLGLPRIVADELSRFEPDAIVAQSPYEALAVLAARPAAGRRPRLIVEVHGDWRSAARLYGSRARRAYAALADRGALFALRRADGTRTLSRYTTELAREATGHEPLAAFPAYTDLGSFLGEIRPLPETPTIAWVGMLQRSKNPHTLVAAWRELAVRLPEARLLMVGDGPLRPLVDGLVADFPGRVRAFPRLAPADVAGVLDDSTVLALPSWTEGLGRVVIEAFSRGRPVVAADTGGIPDLVEDGRNGLLVPPGDAHRLAGALGKVLTDRRTAARLAAGARDDAQRVQLHPERYADAVREMVERVMEVAR
jgi:glycosyltransferase involved in cell wall biosynthesis